MNLCQHSLKGLFGSALSKGRAACAADPALGFTGKPGPHTVRMPGKIRACLPTLLHYMGMVSAVSANRSSNPPEMEKTFQSGRAGTGFKHAPWGTKYTTDSQEATG